MRILFSISSIVYIFCIFFFADSSVVSTLSTFNPYSILHIPLYGILTFLLIFSFVPLKFNSTNQTNQRNLSREMGSPFHWDQINQRNWKNFYLLPGGIALIVAIADEIHQAYVPGRDASITDVLLDFVGIILILFIFLYFYKIQKIRKANTIIT